MLVLYATRRSLFLAPEENFGSLERDYSLSKGADMTLEKGKINTAKMFSCTKHSFVIRYSRTISASIDVQRNRHKL